MADENTTLSGQEVAELRRILQTLSQQQNVASSAATSSQTSKFEGWLGALGTSAKALLAICILLVGVVIGVSSGAFGSRAKQSYQDELQRSLGAQGVPSLPVDMTKEDVMKLINEQASKNFGAAGLGGDTRELIATLNKSLEADQRNAEVTQKAYEDALKRIAESRDAAIARGQQGVDVEKAIRETLDRLGIKAEAQDISCLTDPNWEPGKAAAAMVAEENERRQAERAAAASAAEAAASAIGNTKQPAKAAKSG